MQFFLLSVSLVYLVRVCFFAWVVCLRDCGCFALGFVWVACYLFGLLGCDCWLPLVCGLFVTYAPFRVVFWIACCGVAGFDCGWFGWYLVVCYVGWCELLVVDVAVVGFVM